MAASSMSKDVSVLVCAADPLVACAIVRTLRRRAYVVEETPLAEVVEREAQLVILDLDLPGSEAALGRLRRLPSPPLLIALSSSTDVRSAVRAMRLGAIDYLETPLSLDQLIDRVDRAVDTATVQARLSRAAHTSLTRERPGLVDAASGGFVAASPKMRVVLELARRVASTARASALLLGETGAGKEVVAAFIHKHSARTARPFVRMNMAALPDSMVESEMFGYVKGSFTDARRDRDGLFASADGGTLLLDELGEFSMHLQPKLLRVLEEQAFYPVGSDRLRRIDVRFLAATNRPPLQAIEQGILRRDLYYRLGTVVIEIPPLRERREDVIPLARHFLGLGRGDAGPPPSLTPEAERALLAHHWPGNARELRNVMERATMLSDGGVIHVDALALALDATPSPAPATVLEEERGSGPELTLDAARQAAIERVEPVQIRRALSACRGSISSAAELLGVSRTTLWSKMRRYGIEAA